MLVFLLSFNLLFSSCDINLIDSNTKQCSELLTKYKLDCSCILPKTDNKEADKHLIAMCESACSCINLGFKARQVCFDVKK